MDFTNDKRKRPDLVARNKANATHKMSHTSTYNIWNSMHQRCVNKKRKDYHRYGGRGIRVCSRWDLFDNFLSDMGVRPPGMQLDRIDNNGPYELNNCRWVTPRSNSCNRKTNRKVDFNGERLTIAEWSRRLGISRQAFRYRLNKGWPIEQIFNTPLDKGNAWKRGSR